MPIVVFNPSEFKMRYPQFENVDDTLLGLYFEEAGLYLSNADNSPVQNVTKRALLLNMLVAHVGSLAGALSEDGAPSPVGRISQATEGSVSVSFESVGVPGSKDWFYQTQYGAAFWQATSNLRSFRYYPRNVIIR